MLEDNIKLAVKYGVILGTIAGVREKSRGQDKEKWKKITKQQAAVLLRRRQPISGENSLFNRLVLAKIFRVCSVACSHQALFILSNLQPPARPRFC